MPRSYEIDFNMVFIGIIRAVQGQRVFIERDGKIFQKFFVTYEMSKTLSESIGDEVIFFGIGERNRKGDTVRYYATQIAKR